VAVIVIVDTVGIVGIGVVVVVGIGVVGDGNSLLVDGFGREGWMDLSYRFGYRFGVCFWFVVDKIL